MPTLYSLNVRWVKTQLNTHLIENILNKAGDWFRFDGWSWLVASEYSASDITNALRTVLTPDDSILIIKCDASNFGGFAPQLTWEWLNKYRPEVPRALNSGLGALASNSALSSAFPPPGLGGMPFPKKQ